MKSNKKKKKVLFFEQKSNNYENFISHKENDLQTEEDGNRKQQENKDESALVFENEPSKTNSKTRVTKKEKIKQWRLQLMLLYQIFTIS